MSLSAENKPIHTILLDASPILLNTPSISTLTATCNTLVTTSAVISEIKGEEARNRFETLYKPFIEIHTPKPESIKLVRDFARRTGDLAVLSATDIEVLALAYELECERNGGDWRLRSVPGQKRVNGAPPKKEEQLAIVQGDDAPSVADTTRDAAGTAGEDKRLEETTEGLRAATLESAVLGQQPQEESVPLQAKDEVEEILKPEVDGVPELEEDNSADSDDGWITPLNIKRRKAKDEGAADTKDQPQKTLQVATMTGDFAMQNVLLQMNLNLLSTKSCKRITNIKQTIFRCHACFQTTRDMSKQFCPRCGKPTLTRVTCTTNDKGEVKLHLKANYQWNNRGNVYSVPRPTAGTANQKWKGPKSGGGQSGWGNDLILTEDQKEYQRAVKGQQRSRQKDLMDEDSLPGILTGQRSSAGRIQVGAGKSINSRKR
ncbi:20S-pre-rRNA D-site endonuclease nob1 [Lithohypha guttulata]|uniref:20S-pre-rRNA D-site endonuclease nob1 n=1 Tax=Lithohypha guttulata TaxID=1690604 RepID=UPI002DDE3BD7|nr:20S-pre-rRNA D-site endonuclease nob1 [Lithohypha guttulata]